MRRSRPRPLATAAALLAASALAASRAEIARAEGDGQRAAGDEPAEVTVRGQTAGGFTSRSQLEDAPREITDAASLVEPMAGVHVRRLGADDSFATISVRGASSTQVAVYLAGVPLTGGADPTLDLATLPLWPGARATVHRSFAPAALGRGSLGGTLSLDAPSPRARTRTDVWAAAGAFGARRLRIGDVRGADGEEGGVRVATGLSVSRSDDDFSYVDKAAGSQGRLALVDRENAGHAAASGLAAVAIPLTREGGGALTSTTLLQARRQRLPGTATRPTRFQRLDSSRVMSALELTVLAGPGAFGVRGWGRREGLALSDSPLDTDGLSPTSTADAVIAAGTSAGWRGRPADALTIEARLDGSVERFAPGAWVGAASPPGARRSSAGAAFDGKLRATRATTLAASARTDVWFDGSDDGAASRSFFPTGNVGVETVAGPLTIASHGGFVARPPSFMERYGNRGGFIGEPDLRPESAVTIDLGGKLGTALGPARVEAELAVFGTWADDLIVFVPQGAYGRAKATNIGRARLAGTEASVRARAWGFDLRATHTGLVTANQSACRFAAGACERPALPGRPEHDVAADLSYTLGIVRVRYGVDVVTGISADGSASDAYRVPDRALHYAGVRVDVPGAPGLSLSVDVRNLFDLRVAEYPNALGGRDPHPIGDLFEYPIPGRRMLAALRWEHAPPRPDQAAGAPAR